MLRLVKNATVLTGKAQVSSTINKAVTSPKTSIFRGLSLDAVYVIFWFPNTKLESVIPYQLGIRDFEKKKVVLFCF